MKKKLRIEILLAMGMAFIFAGCGTGGDSQKRVETSEAASQADITENIGSTEMTVETEAVSEMETQSAETEPAYTIEKVSAKSDGHKVMAVLYRPAGDDVTDCPVVIISPGFSANYTYFTTYGEELAENGFAAAIMEFYGGSPNSLSGGSMREMTVFTEQADLEAVMDQLKEDETLDTEQFYLIGHSQGGFVSTLVAADRPDEVADLYLIAPAFHIPDAMRETFTSYDKIAEQNSGNGVIVGKEYAQAVYDFDIYEEMPKYEGKVAIWHGTEDEAVPMEYSERAAETFPDASLTKVDGAGHNFPDPFREMLLTELFADASGK